MLIIPYRTVNHSFTPAAADDIALVVGVGIVLVPGRKVSPMESVTVACPKL
jgi:hypothetical protein